jgi:L-ribulokinase
MGAVNRAAYTPNATAADAYDRLYAEYVQLHDYFGRGGNNVMHRLAALRREGFRAGLETTTAAGKGDNA